MTVTKEQVQDAFVSGGYTLNERFRGCGFVYFPLGKPQTAENPKQGRVFFKAEDKGDDIEISLSVSWEFPTDNQKDEILKTLALYMTYRRQNAKVAT